MNTRKGRNESKRDVGASRNCIRREKRSSVNHDAVEEHLVGIEQQARTVSATHFDDPPRPKASSIENKTLASWAPKYSFSQMEAIRLTRIAAAGGAETGMFP